MARTKRTKMKHREYYEFDSSVNDIGLALTRTRWTFSGNRPVHDSSSERRGRIYGKTFPVFVTFADKRGIFRGEFDFCPIRCTLRSG